MNYDLLIAIVIANAVMTLSILLRSLSRAQTKAPTPNQKDRTGFMVQQAHRA